MTRVMETSSPRAAGRSRQGGRRRRDDRKGAHANRSTTKANSRHQGGPLHLQVKLIEHSTSSSTTLPTAGDLRGGRGWGTYFTTWVPCVGTDLPHAFWKRSRDGVRKTHAEEVSTASLARDERAGRDHAPAEGKELTLSTARGLHHRGTQPRWLSFLTGPGPHLKCRRNSPTGFTTTDRPRLARSGIAWSRAGATSPHYSNGGSVGWLYPERFARRTSAWYKTQARSPHRKGRRSSPDPYSREWRATIPTSAPCQRLEITKAKRCRHVGYAIAMATAIARARRLAPEINRLTDNREHHSMSCGSAHG